MYVYRNALCKHLQAKQCIDLIHAMTSVKLLDRVVEYAIPEFSICTEAFNDMSIHTFRARSIQQ
jgi:hypothetical protein